MIKGTWIVEYKCGCSEDAHSKSELLNYCAKHGADKRRFYFIPDSLLPKKVKGENNTVC
jgi:hypothetical protein